MILGFGGYSRWVYLSSILLILLQLKLTLALPGTVRNWQGQGNQQPTSNKQGICCRNPAYGQGKHVVYSKRTNAVCKQKKKRTADMFQGMLHLCFGSTYMAYIHIIYMCKCSEPLRKLAGFFLLVQEPLVDRHSKRTSRKHTHKNTLVWRTCFRR